MPGDQINKFREALSTNAYFQSVLSKTNAVRLLEEHYGVDHPQLVPHLTVAMGPLRAGVVHELEHSLPIHARARELSLLTPDRNGRWSLYARFRLGRAVSSLESRR